MLSSSDLIAHWQILTGSLNRPSQPDTSPHPSTVDTDRMPNKVEGDTTDSAERCGSKLSPPSPDNGDATPSKEKTESVLETSGPNKLADALSQHLAERKRIDKELAAARKQALERIFMPTWLPDNYSVTALTSLHESFLNGQLKQQEGREESPEPEDLTVKTKDKESPDPDKMKSDDHDTISSSADTSSQDQPNWSYEEQFKQLYELSEDSKRKEWLDDWLNFMHRIGKPVTRIPIMAKQVLDLYELYRLVVAHGGLVEIINKKLWREITKGLNLPSSITSAAFTLRTQYQKYLYDYECDRERLSSPTELQAAIDGNRREGRRNNPAYTNPYLPPSLLSPKNMNGSPILREEESVATSTCGPGSSGALPVAAQQAAMVAAYREQMALEAQRAAALEAAQRHHQNTTRPSGRTSTSSNESESSAPATKRPHLDNSLERIIGSMSSTHIKVTRSSGNNTLIVSMEIDGVMYQGVLIRAQPAVALPSGTP